MRCAVHLITPFSILLLLALRLTAQDLPTGPAKLLVPGGTPVRLQVAHTISSAHARKNDRLDFVVADDVAVDGYTLIRAGAVALGSVVRVKGKRPLGMGGDVIVKLDSVELTNGERVELVAHKEFRGRSPVFLLTRGRDSTVLKGAEVTAYTNSETSVETEFLPIARKSDSELAEMITLLPPRALNGEGRQGDMLNLVFMAKEDDLQGAFEQAGWLKVEKSPPQIIWHLMWQRTHYTKLPMDKLYVFGRPQDYAYSLPDPKAVVARRHHLRIWKTDRQVDGVPLWVGAATHDVAIEFVKHKFRLLHKIDPNVDEEREFVAHNLAEAKQLTREQYVNCREPVFRAQTATGQQYYSDSKMLFLELNQRADPRAGATEVAVKLP
jgi:LssY C-terminus